MRQVHIIFDPTGKAKDRLEAELNLVAPCAVKINYGHPVSPNGQRCYGYYSHDKRLVEINLGVDWYANNKLHIVKKELLDTILHEFRHAHQFDHWSPARYRIEAEIEMDAEKWAQQNTPNYRDLIQLRTTTRQSLSRLSQAEARVR